MRPRNVMLIVLCTWLVASVATISGAAKAVGTYASGLAQPVQQSPDDAGVRDFFLALHDNKRTCQTFVVPDGKRFVVQEITINGQVAAGAQLGDVTITYESPELSGSRIVSADLDILPSVVSRTSEATVYGADRALTLYVMPSTTLSVCGSRTGSKEVPSLHQFVDVAISGYYTPPA